MKKNIYISFLLLGLSAVLFQTLIVREVVSSFYGNEIFIGIIFAIWLIWTALGSKYIAKFFKKKLIFLKKLHLFLPLAFLIEIMLLRFYPTFNQFSGEIPNYLISILAIIFILAPVCIILGILWTTASYLVSFKSLKILNINKGYFLEIIGFIIGGILFSFFLVNLNIFKLIFILTLIHFTWSFFICQTNKEKLIFMIIIPLITVSIFSPLPNILNKETISFKFPNQKLIEMVNSPYGNILITKINNQYNFYENGSLISHTQNQEFGEKLVHLSNLYNKEFNTALVVGLESSSMINELLKYPYKKIYYLQPSAKINNILKNYLSKSAQKTLENKRVEILYNDIFSLIKQKKYQFSNIFIDNANPSTALINRVYTKDFFKLAKSNLGKKGIITVYLQSSPSQTNQNLKKLNTSIYQSLSKTFLNTKVLSGNNNIYLASKQNKFTQQNKSLINSFNKRNIKTDLVNQAYLSYRLARSDFNFLSKNVKINTLLCPVGYFYNSLFWLDHFYPQLSQLFQIIVNHFWYILAFFILLAVLIIKKRKKYALFSSACIGAISSMSFEVIIIMTYQNLIGYLYYRVALLIALFTLGMALGIWKSFKIKNINLQKLEKYHFFIVIISILLILTFHYISIFNYQIQELICLILSIIAGFFTAIIFPIVNKIYLKTQKHIYKKTSQIYSSDLLGASLGSILPVVILPILGLFQTILVIIILNIFIIVIIKLAKIPGR